MWFCSYICPDLLRNSLITKDVSFLLSLEFLFMFSCSFIFLSRYIFCIPFLYPAFTWTLRLLYSAPICLLTLLTLTLSNMYLRGTLYLSFWTLVRCLKKKKKTNWCRRYWYIVLRFVAIAKSLFSLHGTVYWALKSKLPNKKKKLKLIKPLYPNQ